MLIQRQPVINSAHARPPACTHASTYLTARPSRRRLVSWFVSGQRQPRPVHTKTRPDPISTTSPERSEGMHPSRPCLRLLCPRPLLLMTLMLLAGLAGCGPASSDHAPNLGPRASVDGPPLSKQGPSPHNNAFTSVTPAASPEPRASVQGTGAVSGMGTPPEGDRRQVVSAPSPSPVDSPNPDDSDSLDIRVVPDWMAKELASPDVNARLWALETWAQSAPPGAVDPLIQALNDKDERVQVLAKELIEEDEYRGLDEEEENQDLDEEKEK